MPPVIEGVCLGKALLAVVFLGAVAILAGIVFARSFDRRLTGRGRVVTVRGLPPATVGRELPPV